MKAYRLTVCGEVQGVGFRASVRRHALKLGLKGYAKNLPNGCVEIVIAADSRDSVEALLESVKKLRTAKISRVEVQEVEVDYVPGGFEVY